MKHFLEESKSELIRSHDLLTSSPIFMLTSLINHFLMATSVQPQSFEFPSLSVCGNVLTVTVERLQDVVCFPYQCLPDWHVVVCYGFVYLSLFCNELDYLFRPRNKIFLHPPGVGLPRGSALGRRFSRSSNSCRTLSVTQQEPIRGEEKEWGRAREGWHNLAF